MRTAGTASRMTHRRLAAEGMQKPDASRPEHGLQRMQHTGHKVLIPQPPQMPQQPLIYLAACHQRQHLPCCSKHLCSIYPCQSCSSSPTAFAVLLRAHDGLSSLVWLEATNTICRPALCICTNFSVSCQEHGSVLQLPLWPAFKNRCQKHLIRNYMHEA